VHVYLDRENCFELIFLNGKGEDIAELAESIIALKGVKFSKLTTISLTK
jgi:CopG family nickel-responsive transcriptional regulator